MAEAGREVGIECGSLVTAWTNGHQIWCTSAGQHYAWLAADIEAAAATLAGLAYRVPGA